MAIVEAPPANAQTSEFEEFFVRAYPRLLRLMYGLSGSASEAEDLAQEALARAFERWDRVAGMEAPEGYVYRIGVNLYRQRRRRLLRRLIPNENPTSEPPIGSTDVAEALASLTRPLREAFLLVDWMGYSSEEAGRILSIAAGSVRARVHRARLQLRMALGADDD